MLTCGKRIKVLRGIDSVRFNVSYQAFQFLVDFLPHCLLRVDHIMPNLTDISFLTGELTCDEFSLNLCGLLVSSLRSVIFTVSCMGLFEHIDTVILTVLQNCPRLESLEIICTGLLCDQGPVLLDFGYCFPEHAGHVETLSTAALVTPLNVVQVTPVKRTGYCDIVCTPMTCVVLGAFRRITQLNISLDTSYQFEYSPPFEGPGSAFPALRHLRLRVHGSDPLTWFFDAINGEKLISLSLHFVEQITASKLDTFLSSLDPFKEKFSEIKDLALRAIVYDEANPSQIPHQVIQSTVTTAARVFSSVWYFKLKLFPSYSPQEGLIRADDLPHIAGAFPALQSLKLATNAAFVNLTDVVALARRFPGLYTIGMNFNCSEISSLYKDEPSGRLPPDEEARESMHLSLNVRHSGIQYPEQVAAYLRKSLPRLCNIARSRKSTHEGWDTVHKLLCDRM